MMKLTNYALHVYLKQGRLLNYFHSLDCPEYQRIIRKLKSSLYFEITGCICMQKEFRAC